MQSIQVTDPTPRIRSSLFGVQGMTCSACTNAIHDAVSQLPSVESVNVSLLNNSMSVTYDSNGLSVKDLLDLVEDLGYEPTEYETKEVKPADGTKNGNSGKEGTDSDIVEREVQLEFSGIDNRESADTLNEYLEGLGLLSFTPLSDSRPRTTIRYTPRPASVPSTSSPSLNIRNIIRNIPHPFSAKVYQPPSLHSRSREIQRRDAQTYIRLFLASAVFAVPTFVIGVVGMLLLPQSNRFRQWCQGVGWWGGASRAVILLWVFATCVQFGITRIFFVHGWASLRFQKSWKMFFRFGNMSLLVALSTGVAYVASVVMMVIDIRTSPEMAAMSTEMRTYFDSCVFLTFFILMGKSLEARAKLKTGDAIAMLGQLRPERALLLSNNNETGTPSTPEAKSQRTEEVPVDMLEIGDYILVRPGSIPPADGIIVEGSTTVDESSLTGEAVPILKDKGDSILTGTTVLSSAVVVQVNHLGDETMLQQIVRAVAESQNTKAPIEELADRVTAIFVPVIIYLSIIVLVIWLSLSLTPENKGGIPASYLSETHCQTADRVFFAFEFAIALLAVACPCGIGLAAPAAQAVGSGMAARAGILAQGGGTAFQLATQVNTVVFDKTGTLTMGTPTVVRSHIFPFFPSKTLLDSSGKAEQTPETVKEDGKSQESGAREGEDKAWILEAIRLIEQNSSHPLAAALVRYVEAQQTLPTSASGENEKEDVDQHRQSTTAPRASTPKPIPSTVKLLQTEEIAGKGAQGQLEIEGRTFTFCLGNAALMGDNATYSTYPTIEKDGRGDTEGAKVVNSDQDSKYRQEVENWKAQGFSVVFFAISPLSNSTLSTPSAQDDNTENPKRNSTSSANTNDSAHSTPSSTSASTTLLPCDPIPTSAMPLSIIAHFAIADPARPEAKKVITALKKAGKEVYMLSGDNEITARAVGLELGIANDRVIAGVLPQQKARFIKLLQNSSSFQDLQDHLTFRGLQNPQNPRDLQGLQGLRGSLKGQPAFEIRDLREKSVSQENTATLWGNWENEEAKENAENKKGGDIKKTKSKAVVMFAGDGLNDSAAVAGADVGVAFAHGSQITLTSASFVILQTKAPLEGVLELLTLSRKVYLRQKFNFGWAMVYNVILIPLAAGAFYPLNHTRIPPVWSALAMALSSVSVVMSSLALRWGL